MRVIYCNIDPFAYDQEVYVLDGQDKTKIGKSPIESLPQFISNKCDELNIEEVNLTGITNYTTNLSFKIYECFQTKYSNKKINVIVR